MHTKLKPNKMLLALGVAGLMCSSTNLIHATSSYVIFPLTGYVNPANMDFVEHFSIMGEGHAVFFSNQFNGTQVGAPGLSSSGTRNYYAPAGEIKWRVAPKLVLGFDLSDPIDALIDFNSGNQIGTKSILNARAYSPKISYQVLDNLTLGAGIDFLHLFKAQLDITGFPGGILEVHGSSFKTTYNLGFLYKIKPTSLLSGSLHKGVNFAPTVTVSLGGITNNGSMNSPLIPDIYGLNFTQIFSKEWLVSLSAKYLVWTPYNNLTIYNSPLGNIVFPQNYNNAWMGQALARYQFAEKWAGIAGVDYFTSPMPIEFRPVGLPSGAGWDLLAMLQYEPTKNIEFALGYIYAYSAPPINNAAAGAVGKVKINVNVVSLGLTYKY